MNKAGTIISINPPRAIPGGEVIINCENFVEYAELRLLFRRQSGANRRRRRIAFWRLFLTILIRRTLRVTSKAAAKEAKRFHITVGKKLADDLHIVANPAVDPKDDSIIVTRSGSRGQQLPVTLFRLEPDGFLGEMSARL